MISSITTYDAKGNPICHRFGCENLATVWEDWERYGDKRFLSTPYCDTDECGKRSRTEESITLRPVRRKA